MLELWNIFAEISVEPQDFSSRNTNGFMNIVTWATSAEMALSKIEVYFRRFNWHVIGIEEANAIPEMFTSMMRNIMTWWSAPS